MYSSQRSNVGELLPSSLRGLLARISAELSCPICLGILHSPMQTPCQHAFCKECIDRALRVSIAQAKPASSQQCPVCKAKVSKRSLVVAGSLQSLVHGFNALCEAYKAAHGQDYCAEDTFKTTPKRYNLYALLVEREKRLDALYSGTHCSDIDQVTSPSIVSIRIPSSPDPFLFQSIPLLPPSPRGRAEGRTSESAVGHKSSPKHDPTGFKFVCTSFLTKEQPKVAAFARTFGMQVRDKVSAKTLLFMADRERIGRRSLKFMTAILLGQPVLSMEYMADCLAVGRLLENLDDYMIRGDEFSCDDTISRSIQSHRQNEPGLFHGLKFYFCGRFDRPSLPELQQLVSLGSGSVVPSVSKLPKGGILLCDLASAGSLGKDAGMIAKHRPVVSINWIMDCISSYSLLDRQAYIVSCD